MEVSGYPHYENVCSNILKFFFDPTAEHGLHDLLLVAFMRMAGVTEIPNIENVRVGSQQATERGNFIDLVVDSESFTIGIENKIFHWLANDLEDYGAHIDRLAVSRPIVIKAVLGLHLIPPTETLKGGFVSYSYEQFWHQVRELLGYYIAAADPKWVSYLLDLITTTENLAGRNMELQKNDQFFIDHHDLLEKMLTERTTFISRLNSKVSALCGLMGESEIAATLSRPPWVYAGSCVVLGFHISPDYSIAYDLYLRPTGWELQLFGRNGKSKHYLLSLIGKPALRERTRDVAIVGGRHIVQTWPINTDLGELKDALCSWMESLSAASNSTVA